MVDQEWLVISNCNTFGLANSLSVITVDINVTSLHVWEFQSKILQDPIDLAFYDLVIAAPEVLSLENHGLDKAKRLELIPPVIFDAYHPDLCYAHTPKGLAKTPLDAYHSIIALAAYNNGLNLSDTMRLYNRNTYQNCGYLDLWDQSAAMLLRNFAQYGLDIGPAFLHWLRDGPFMYSINHPKIKCLFGVASSFLKKIQVDGSFSLQYLPDDNLAKGPVFPVYTEIAEHYGVRGDYFFKPMDMYKMLKIEKFVEYSFAAYQTHGLENMQVQPSDTFKERYDIVSAFIRSGSWS